MKRRERQKVDYEFFSCDKAKIIAEIGADNLIDSLKNMLLIRHFETRAESAYQMGKIGGFFHGYAGQEAIQTSAVLALGPDNWFTTTYRCHALALLLGATPNEAMAELYGKETGNAKGRGGSMHLYSDRMLGGYGIVGGHMPIVMGAGFSLMYENKEGVSIGFLGDGAVAQGAFHESLNIASLWDLPCIVVIENNLWGMGTGVERAICKQPIARSFAGSYDMESYELDGMDFFSCYAAFKEMQEKIKKNPRPILVEAITERFKGHSVSDPGLYRSKNELKDAQTRDPITLLKDALIENKLLTEDKFEDLSKRAKQIVVDSMKFAEESKEPNPANLEEDVFAP